MADIHDFEPLFGSWYVEGLLGKGSYGNVYRARRSEFGNTFYSAIKHIAIEDTEDFSAKQQAQALSREININYQLRGETHFVSFEDSTFVNRPDGSGVDVFIRMELLTSLTQRMKQNPLDEKEVVRLGIDICEALDGLEKRNIIHRDIKPANIFISDTGAYKLGDFGVARSLGGTTSGMTVAGTFNYMAPEIYRGGTVNHTADIYSLGLVLYRLLNGDRAPFLPPPPASPTYEDANAALSRRMNGEALPPPAYASREVAEVILLACAYDPGRRWQSARAFANALRSAAGQSGGSTGGGYSGGGSTGGGYNGGGGTGGGHNGGGKNKGLLFGGIAAAVIVAILLLVLHPWSDSGNSSAPSASTAPPSASQPSATAPSTTAPQTTPPQTTPLQTAAPMYTIATYAGTGGMIVPGGNVSLYAGESQTFTVIPDNGYVIDYVEIDGVPQGNNDRYTVTVNDGNRTIMAWFRQSYSVSVVKADVSWAAAYDAAYAAGGHLATVMSRDELDRLIDEADRQGVKVLLLGGYLDWSGSRYTAHWITGEDFSYAAWHSGEPNNYGGTENRIALMQTSNGAWGLCDVPDDAYTYYAGRGIVGYAIEWEG